MSDALTEHGARNQAEQGGAYTIFRQVVAACRAPVSVGLLFTVSEVCRFAVPSSSR